jgi:hypothetical protein
MTAPHEQRETLFWRKAAWAVMIAAALPGCVQIDTPDKPIEINLNINIRQEIVYQLDGDARKLIEQNSEIF